MTSIIVLIILGIIRSVMLSVSYIAIQITHIYKFGRNIFTIIL